MNMRNTLRGALRRIVEFPPFALGEKGLSTLSNVNLFRLAQKGGAPNSPAALAAAGAEPAR
jgi:hypothetical protein